MLRYDFFQGSETTWTDILKILSISFSSFQYSFISIDLVKLVFILLLWERMFGQTENSIQHMNDLLQLSVFGHVNYIFLRGIQKMKGRKVTGGRTRAAIFPAGLTPADNSAGTPVITGHSSYLLNQTNSIMEAPSPVVVTHDLPAR